MAKEVRGKVGLQGSCSENVAWVQAIPILENLPPNSDHGIIAAVYSFAQVSNYVLAIHHLLPVF